MIENYLSLYNSLSRRKERFVPIHEGRVGMYVCGPTVYGDGHLGHARPAITFDILYRYLNHLGYKVRYVRAILNTMPTKARTRLPRKLDLNSSSPWKWYSTISTATTRPWTT